jgi:hypothetical protein
MSRSCGESLRLASVMTLDPVLAPFCKIRPRPLWFRDKMWADQNARNGTPEMSAAKVKP